MYIQNRRNSSKFKGYSPIQLLNGLIGFKPAIAYFAYTQLIYNNKMDKNFKLAITPNYGKVIWRIIILLLSVIIPIILFGISLEKELINPERVKFELVLPIYLVLVAISTFLVIRKTYFKDIITLTNESMEIPKMRNIDYREITKNKAFTVRGFTSYIITLQEGRKLAIGPVNNFSTSAESTFRDFIIEFEKKVDNTVYSK